VASVSKAFHSFRNFGSLFAKEGIAAFGAKHPTKRKGNKSKKNKRKKVKRNKRARGITSQFVAKGFKPIIGSE